ncbi:MAG: hypothetical protein JNN28_11850 [Saprospiraceae bacterium]|nr:hypothetical protein [Saprospiraceae bacterium]
MENDSRIFPAKLLLFGEHVLLLGATALAVPLPSFFGKWSWQNGINPYFEKMMAFAQSQDLKEISGMDTVKFVADLQHGLFFESNIPTGYGLGSSGAFCAAVYHRYINKPESDPEKLKSILAKMEGYFHGNSSGIDPLTSFMATPVLIRRKTEVELVTSSSWKGDEPIVFLIDSTLPRKSQTMIDWFLAQSKKEEFADFLNNQYLIAHQLMVASWLKADASGFWQNLETISSCQFHYFSPMIPATIRTVWENSLEHREFTLKICGAGGGGFVLGFARKKSLIPKLPPEFAIILPFEEVQIL